MTTGLRTGTCEVCVEEELTEAFCGSLSGEARSPSCPPYSSSCDAVGHASKSVCPRSCRYWKRGEFCEERESHGEKLRNDGWEEWGNAEGESDKTVPDGWRGGERANMCWMSSVWCGLSWHSCCFCPSFSCVNPKVPWLFKATHRHHLITCCASGRSAEV